jgi:hypothetical protein
VKSVFYIPAILFTMLYGMVAMSLGISSISPIALMWIGLFSIAGVLLCKDKFWGGAFGLIPGINLIYMSTKDTGQVMDIEKPMGVAVLIFYVLCSGFVFFKRTKKLDTN